MIIDFCYIRKLDRIIPYHISPLFQVSSTEKKNHSLFYVKGKKIPNKKGKKCKIFKTCFHSTKWELILSSPIYTNACICITIHTSI